MQLSAHGWNRNCGERTLLNTTLRDKQPQERLHLEQVSMNGNISGVQVWWGKGDVQLNGNYSFTLDSTRSDVARLFVDAFSGMDLQNVFLFLAQAREKGEPPEG